MRHFLPIHFAHFAHFGGHGGDAAGLLAFVAIIVGAALLFRPTKD